MLKLSLPNIDEAAIARVADVLRSGQLVHGGENEAFEQELAAYLGCREVVLVSSGTAALHLALMALDIGPGDAVIVPDFTFPATANAVVMTGARVVIADVEPDDYCLSAASVEELILAWQGPETLRAVMPVHEFGSPADMAGINRVAARHGLTVIEDAACALGAVLNEGKAGVQGRVGCFSFHPRKTLTTGEGGALATDDVALARRLRRLRNHGMERTDKGMVFLESSTNYRLTNFQAALGRCQLPSLDDWIGRRRALADIYAVALMPLSEAGYLTLPVSRPGHSWQTFMVVLRDDLDRSRIIAGLNGQGIEANLGAQSLSVLGLYGENVASHGARLFRQGLALPLYERLTVEDVQRVCAVLTAILTAG